MKNIFYFSHLNVIGGIEQFFAYLSEKYKDWDITIVYRTGDKKQINRIKKFVRVVKFSGQQFQCDKAFFCFNTDIKSYITAKEYCLVLHGDYKAMVEQNQLSKDCYIFKEKFDKYYSVSKTVADSWESLTGVPCEVVYNPFVQQPTKKILKFVYCGRLSAEKGGDTVNEFLHALDTRNIDYILYVYSNKHSIEGNNVVYLNTRLDAGQFLNKDNYDFILISSKNEGYCYSLIQALSNGLPAIVTPCPVFTELGVNKTNSILLQTDCSNVEEVIEKALTKNFEFSYAPKDDTWDKVLAKGKTTYSYKEVEICATANYLDMEIDEHIKVGARYKVTKERAEQIIGFGLAQYTNTDEV